MKVLILLLLASCASTEKLVSVVTDGIVEDAVVAREDKIERLKDKYCDEEAACPALPEVVKICDLYKKQDSFFSSYKKINCLHVVPGYEDEGIKD